METKRAVEILRQHNEWRRGAELPMEDPTELGEAIDAVCEIGERFNLSVDERGLWATDEDGNRNLILKPWQKQMSDAVVATFPSGITDEQIIWQVVERDLLREVAKQMSDAVLIDELNKRLKRYGLQR